jgi:hypothetical protein
MEDIKEANDMISRQSMKNGTTRTAKERGKLEIGNANRYNLAVLLHVRTL